MSKLTILRFDAKSGRVRLAAVALACTLAAAGCTTSGINNPGAGEPTRGGAGAGPTVPSSTPGSYYRGEGRMISSGGARVPGGPLLEDDPVTQPAPPPSPQPAVQPVPGSDAATAVVSVAVPPDDFPATPTIRPANPVSPVAVAAAGTMMSPAAATTAAASASTTTATTQPATTQAVVKSPAVSTKVAGPAKVNTAKLPPAEWIIPRKPASQASMTSRLSAEASTSTSTLSRAVSKAIGKPGVSRVQIVQSKNGEVVAVNKQ